MSYQDTYEAWLNSPALSAQEKAELESIRCPSAPPVCGGPWAWAFIG